MTHGATTALAIKAVLEFVQSNFSGRTVGVYEDNEGAKTGLEIPRVLTAAST